MKLSDHIDSLTRSYWEFWKTLKQTEGWTLGPDIGESKMNPYLVHSFDGLTNEGKDKFLSEAALFIHAIESVVETPSEVCVDSPGDETTTRAVLKLDQALTAMDSAEWMTAERKVRTARKMLAGEPLRAKPTKSAKAD